MTCLPLEYWLTLIQVKVSEWNDMSTRGILVDSDSG
jgi:hypothetical protein